MHRETDRPLGAGGQEDQAAGNGQPEGAGGAGARGTAEPPGDGVEPGAPQDAPGEDGPEAAAGGDGGPSDGDGDAYQQLLASHQELVEAHQQLSEQHQGLSEAYQKLRDAYARLQADYDNFRRRTREEEARRKQEAAEDLITELLPVLDNMQRAVDAAESAGSVGDGIRSGVQLIMQQLNAVMEKRGVRVVPGVGEPFDPRWHHAVAQEEGAADGGPDAVLVVVEQFQRGYMLGDKVLRPSLVQVGRRPRQAEATDSGKGNER